MLNFYRKRAGLEYQLFFYIRCNLIHRDPDLLHRVSVSYSNTAVCFSIRVYSDTERSSYLVLTSVSLADAARQIVINVELL